MRRSPLVNFGSENYVNRQHLNNNNDDWHPEKGKTTKRNVQLGKVGFTLIKVKN